MYKNICLLLVGLILGYIISPTVKKYAFVEPVIQTDTVILTDTVYVNIPKLNKENLRKELIKQGIINPEIVLAQALLETNHFQSRVCREENNLFGLMKNGSYRTFKNWPECVTAYKNLIQNRYKEHENYFVFLDRIGYAEDPEYIQKIKHSL